MRVTHGEGKSEWGKLLNQIVFFRAVRFDLFEARGLGLRENTKQSILILGMDNASEPKKRAVMVCKPHERVINTSLRIELNEVFAPPAAKPYRTKPHAMGLREGLSYDNIFELIAAIEGEDPIEGREILTRRRGGRGEGKYERAR